MNQWKLAGTALAIALAGCGGGSGGGSASNGSTAPVAEVPPVVVTPVPTTPTLVTVSPASTYTGRALDAYNVINQNRLACGFGALAQNVKLDASAAAHAAYIGANGNLSTHDEVLGAPGFTGATVAARTAAAGYSGQSSEAVNVTSGGVASGASLVSPLISAPYHAIDMLTGWREVGVSISENNIVINYGLPTGLTPQTSGQVRTYPCDGLVGAPFGGSGETPRPFPNKPADYNWGTPVIVVGTGALRITSASITGPSGLVTLAAIYADGQTADPQGRCKGNLACVIPELLAMNAKHDVVITGTNDGVAFEKRFSFTTSGVIR